MAKIFDTTIIGKNTRSAIDFIINILQASTEYSIIGKDLNGTILLWNEGAKRLYGYEPYEVVGKANATILHTPEDNKAGKLKKMMKIALEQGKWDGTITRVKKNGEHFLAHAVLTPRYDLNGKPIGFLLISRDISSEIRLIEQLKQIQLYTRSLIEASIDAFMATDLLGIITDVNTQMEKLIGKNREELIGTPFKKYCTDTKRAEEVIRQVLVEEQVMNYELTLLATNNQQTNVSFNASIFYDAKGKLHGIFVTARDITEQKKIEQRLRDAQLYTRSLLEASIDALFAISPEGIITDINEETSRLLEFPRKHLLDTKFADYFTEPERAKKGLQIIYKKGRVANYELVLITHSKQQIIVSLNAAVFYDATGKPQGILASARDISSQKQTEQQLRTAQLYTRSLIEASIDAMMITDPIGNITDINQEMIKLTGYSRKQLLGSSFYKYFTNATLAEKAITLVLKENHLTDYELTIKAKNGQKIIVSYNATTFYDQAGKLQGILAVARDITERKIAEKKFNDLLTALQRSNEELQQFAYIASHDLQEPLRMVESYVQLLERRYKNKLDKDANDFIGFAVDGVNRMQRLVNDLLFYSRVITKAKPFSQVNCNQVLEQVLFDLQPQIKEKEAEIISEELPIVIADETQIARVLQNLISNAIKFCKRKPKIHIKVKKHENEWIFAITDNGIGIALEYYQQIFVIFKRLHTRAEYPGTGLGLAICKKIIERHGGRIWVKSEPGKGSTFYFTLPKKEVDHGTTTTTD